MQRTKGVLSILLLVGAVAGCSQSSVQEHLDRGRSYLAEGQLRSAVIEFKNALQLDPGNPEARFELGRTYLTLGDNRFAVKELERALDLGYAEDEILPPLLQAKVDLGLVNEVLGTLDGLDRLSPELLVIRGHAELLAGDDAQAREAFATALAQNASLGQAYIGLALLALGENGPETALEWLLKGAEADPGNRRLWLVYADVRLMLDDRAGARLAFERAAALPGGDRIPQLGLVRLLLVEERYEEARDRLSDELARDGDHTGFNYFMALCDYHDGHYDEARSRLQVVQSKNPDHLLAMLLMGNVQYQLGNMNQASQNLARYVARNPGDLRAKKVLAAAYMASGSPADAVEVLGPQARALEDAESRRLLGSAYLATGDYFLATEQFDAALAIEPKGTDTRTRLAVSLLNLGETDAGVARLEEAVELNEASADDTTLLIITYIRQGKLDEAAEAARRFSEREPKNPQAYNMLGAVAMEKGDTAEASVAFERALELDPGFAPAAINLAKLANANGNADEVERLFTELLKHHENNLTALMELARLAVARSDVAEATSLLTQARQAHPTSVRPPLALARLALQSGDSKRALKLAIELVEMAVNDPDVRLVAAQASMANGLTVDASRHLEAIQAMNLSDSTDPEFFARVASAQRRVDQFEYAQINFQKALDGGLKNPLVCLGLAEAALHNEDPDTAQRAIRLLADSDSLPAGAVSSLAGDAYVLKGQDDEAIRSYREAVDAGHVPAIVSLAAAIGRRDGAGAEIEFLRSEVSANAEYLPARRRLAERDLVVGNYDRAIEEFESLREVAGDPEVLNNLAWLYFRQGDARAIPLAREAYELAPDDPNVADTLGWALVNTNGNLAEGIRHLEKAADNNPPNPTILYHLAYSYAENGQMAKAVATVDRALALGDFPERPEAEALLAKSTSALSET